MTERGVGRDRLEGTIDEVKGHAKRAWGDLKDKTDDLKEDTERVAR